MPSRHSMLRGISVAICLPVLLSVADAQVRSRSLRTHHIRQEVVTGQARLLNRLPTTQVMHLNIALPLRNEAQLDALLQQLYDPQSPLYHQFLTVPEFTGQFGPTEDDYNAVVRFVEQNGLTVTNTSANRLLLDVSAPVANVERTFHVVMGSYQHPYEPRSFFSPDREPSVDLQVPLAHITGLENFSIPHPASLRRALDPQSAPIKGTPGNTTGSGPNGYFIGSDMRAAYYGGTALTGAGQSVGLLEFAGYNAADVTNYFTNVRQVDSVPVVGVLADTTSSLSCTGKCDDTEQVLDIEVAISMAPGLSQVRVYVSDTSDVAILNKMATENSAKSLSCSWGWSPADPKSDDSIFQEFAAQGQTFFVASGDNGAYTKHAQYVYPADDPWVVSVGGTDLTTTTGGGPWASETAWRYSGGGISPNNIAIPSYQTTARVITTANKGSKTYRNAPDVAAEANTDNYICYNGTCAGGWGGTSFAAPRWAGYLALANQQAVASKFTKGGLGFINPAIYGLSKTNYATAFHDIVSGSNGAYSTQTGYDLVTGWGSPTPGLINVLTQ